MNTPPVKTFWYVPVHCFSMAVLSVDLCAWPIQTVGVYSIWRISCALLVNTEVHFHGSVKKNSKPTWRNGIEKYRKDYCSENQLSAQKTEFHCSLSPLLIVWLNLKMLWTQRRTTNRGITRVLEEFRLAGLPVECIAIVKRICKIKPNRKETIVMEAG